MLLQCLETVDRVAVHDANTDILILQLAVEIGYRLANEPPVTRAVVLILEQSGFEQVQQQHRPGLPTGRRQRRMILQSQIALQPDDADIFPAWLHVPRFPLATW